MIEINIFLHHNADFIFEKEIIAASVKLLVPVLPRTGDMMYLSEAHKEQMVDAMLRAADPLDYWYQYVYGHGFVAVDDVHYVHQVLFNCKDDNKVEIWVEMYHSPVMPD